MKMPNEIEELIGIVSSGQIEAAKELIDLKI